MDIAKLRNILLRPCVNILPVKQKVQDYKNVLKSWNSYCKGNWDSTDPVLNSIFSFRRNGPDHVLLYSSSLIPNKMLALGKVGGEFIHISLPKVADMNKNFVAVYV